MVCSRCHPCDDIPRGRAAFQPAWLRALGFIVSLCPPCASSDCPLQGCGLDLEACPPPCECFEQQSMETVASSLAIGGAGIQVSKTAKKYYRNYRDAEKQISHAQHQREQLLLNLGQLRDLPLSKQECIIPAKASLHDIQEALPAIAHSIRKRDRLHWTTVGKSKFEREISQNQWIENTATFNLIMSLLQDMQKSELDSARRYEELKSSLVYTHSLISNSYIRERRAAEVRHGNWLAKYLGIKSSVIMSTPKTQNHSSISARWPLYLPFGLSQVVTAQILFHNGLPSSLPKLTLRPQSIVPCDSEIIRACETGDIARIRGILETRQAHPNDRTTDDLTVLRAIQKYAVHSGDSSVVQLLLDQGADPNLPFGIYETSPLDIAFRLGNADIIRRLLGAGANLEYQNCRTWTALSYLWDPDRPAPPSTADILTICTGAGFAAWNETDPSGWTPCHRAAAYGTGDDVTSLHYKGGNMRGYTTDDLWGPLTCAVWQDNGSTFDALVDLFDAAEVRDVRDSSGWTLLHLAAENGSRHMIKTLLDLGVDPTALTVAPQHWLPERLVWKKLTAEAIAREFGHGELWDSVATGYYSRK